MAEHVLSGLARFAPQLAYYFNPHLVFTRAGTLDSEARRLVFDGLRSRTAALAQCVNETGDSDGVRNLESHSAGGVPDGESVHDELYFETGDAEHPLHRAGMSFRVRVTLQNDPLQPPSARVLMILTRYPVGPAALAKLGPSAYWQALDSTACCAFAGALRQHRAVLTASTGLPSIAECFVAYLDQPEGAEHFIDDLARYGGPARAIVRIRKVSHKFAIRRWRQNPATGAMDPRWAYATLDRVSTTLLNPGPLLDPGWGKLAQVEVETGPDAAMIDAALGWVDRMDANPGLRANGMAPVFGRKIHRILLAQGIPMGALSDY